MKSKMSNILLSPHNFHNPLTDDNVILYLYMDVICPSVKLFPPFTSSSQAGRQCREWRWGQHARRSRAGSSGWAWGRCWHRRHPLRGFGRWFPCHRWDGPREEDQSVSRTISNFTPLDKGKDNHTDSGRFLSRPSGAASWTLLGTTESPLACEAPCP